MPSELIPSEDYKKSVVEDIKARINKVGNPDIDIAMNAMETSDLKTKKAENKKTCGVRQVENFGSTKVSRAKENRET